MKKISKNEVYKLAGDEYDKFLESCLIVLEGRDVLHYGLCKCDFCQGLERIEDEAFERAGIPEDQRRLYSTGFKNGEIYLNLLTEDELDESDKWCQEQERTLYDLSDWSTEDLLEQDRLFYISVFGKPADWQLELLNLKKKGSE